MLPPFLFAVLAAATLLTGVEREHRTRAVASGLVILALLVLTGWKARFSFEPAMGLTLMGWIMWLSWHVRDEAFAPASAVDRGWPAGYAVNARAVPAGVEERPGPPFPHRIVTRTSPEELTEFTCDFPAASARLVIASPEWSERARGHPALCPFDVGAWPYRVLTTDADYAARLLDAPLRRAIESLDILHAGPILVDIRPGAILVRVAGNLRRGLELESFVEGACAVAGRLRGEAPPDIARRTGECLVCGCPLAGLVVHCARCGTPHHRECWDFAGACSIYACGGRVPA